MIYYYDILKGESLHKIISWNEEKNQLLKIQRGISFEMVLEQIIAGKILARQCHPNKEKYPHQKIFILKIKGYIYYIPFIENEKEIFLKTIIPSRKLKKELKGKDNE